MNSGKWRACPTPHKHRFSTQREANKMLGQTWQQMRGTQLPCRYYRCPCGFWHLTHKPRPQRRLRRGAA